MSLDLFTLSIASALVVTVCGAVFITETLIRRDDPAGQLWALGFFAGIMTTASFAVSAGSPGTWWAVAVGNASFVATSGFMWLGVRRFNEHDVGIPALTVGVAVVAAAAGVLVAGPEGGDWAGALWMFVPILVFAALACGESVRGHLRTVRTAWGLAFVFALQAVYYAARIPVYIVGGPDSELFTTWFGTGNANFITIVLTIVVVIVTSELRAERTGLRGRRVGAAERSGFEILSKEHFEEAFEEVVTRAQWRSSLVGVISVRIDDLDEVGDAFGLEAALAIEDSWRIGVRRYSPLTAPIGEDGQFGVFVAIAPASAAEAGEQAALIRHGLFEALTSTDIVVIPIVGVGVALSDSVGYDRGELERVAREAARRAGADAASVLSDDGDE